MNTDFLWIIDNLSIVTESLANYINCHQLLLGTYQNHYLNIHVQQNNDLCPVSGKLLSDICWVVLKMLI